MVQAQLQLITAESTWRLDEKTRRVGRSGVARARAALASAATTTDNPFAPVEPAASTAAVAEHALAA